METALYFGYLTADWKDGHKNYTFHKVTERIETINGRIKARAEQGKQESRHLVSKLEDCARQIAGIYQ